MLFGKAFRGDINDRLQWIQCELYVELLPYLFFGVRDKFLRAAYLLEVDTELTKTLRELTAFDHRTLQATHDAIAAHFRYNHFLGGQLALPYEGISYDEVLQQDDDVMRKAWRAYFAQEISRLMEDDWFCRSVVLAAVFANKSRGKAGEDMLFHILREKYPELRDTSKED